ncbi:hypothetical protein, partial [Enterovibrio norvegicus]|uniref:hypothetical protein n=2 Tax=Enterovibrio norvegicus TaxID=188144 RepID=UPI001C612484
LSTEHWVFGVVFEAKVATEMSAFFECYDPNKDLTLTVSKHGRVEGSVTIDHSNEKEGVAHLRWFIVSDEMRGKTMGTLCD